MKIALASDHRGYRLKNAIAGYLKEKGHSVVDYGTYSHDSCDYPDYIYPASKSVADKKADRAIVLCYTGIGSCIAANKVRGVRAALAYNLAAARLSRKHNNSNVLVLASKGVKVDNLKRIVSAWLKAGFEGGRHAQRIKKIKEIEERENV
ncbi:MAG: ribose 5-phosphate isomerase B [Candidatus Omnitrophota bacterium]